MNGAQWAKANLDPCWQGLIDRAWNGRPYPAVSSREPADPHDFQATLEFIHYCRNKANTREHEKFADPESRIMKSSTYEGLEQDDNAPI